MSDDPFAEPTDSEATIIRPRPGGRGAAPAAAPMAQPVAGPAVAIPAVGANPLIAAAAPVLAAAVRIGAARASPPDPDALRRAMVEAIRDFEKRALATGLETRSLRAARYALCATIDDLVLSTPWGSTSGWAAQSLTSIFHNEVSGGERFFDILEEMQRDLGKQSEVVELMYLCASLGFEGRYRVMPRGIAALTELRDSVYRGLRQRRGEFERDLSPRWKGLALGYKGLGQRVPVWILASATALIACLVYVLFSFSLSGDAGVAYANLAALPPKGLIHVVRTAPVAPPPPPPVEAASVAAGPTVATFLAPEVRAGAVQVFEDAQSITIRLTNRQMFGSGSAVLNPSYLPLIKRVGAALATRPGRVLVNGYTDNQPIHTVQFPSNWQLSQARANAVAQVLAGTVGDPKRVQAVGKGDADPIAPNTTPQGREQNRRTEVVLMKTASLP